MKLDNLNGVKEFLIISGYKCVERGGIDDIKLMVQKPEILPQPVKVVITTYLKFWKKYQELNVFVFFHDRMSNKIYLYPHDLLLNEISNETGTITETASWHDKEYYNITYLSKVNKGYLEKYRIK